MLKVGFTTTGGIEPSNLSPDTGSSAVTIGLSSFTSVFI